MLIDYLAHKIIAATPKPRQDQHQQRNPDPAGTAKLPPGSALAIVLSPFILLSDNRFNLTF
ncbi:hypothetical protein [Candidatus Spongiihabitans sp.]|uniref:hypothetical protein n=1 Tax=Candidatus Spongiihabitans sp. TaxID=3101308 RepID=UPI003C6FB0EC